MITEQQIIDILNLRESNIDGGETLGIHCIEYGNIAKAIMKLINSKEQEGKICPKCGGEGWIYSLSGNPRKCKHC